MSLLERFRESRLLAMSEGEFGVFQKGRFSESGLPSPAVNGFQLQMGDTFALGGTQNSVWVGATDMSPQKAVLKAYYEGLERSALGFHDPRQLKKNKSFQEISSDFYCPPPEQWALCAEWQYQQDSFPLLPFSKDQILDWVPVHHAWKNEKTLVPFSLVHFTSLKNQPLYSLSTNGTAFHWKLELALASAVLELIERDTLLLYWRCFKKAQPLSMDKILDNELSRLWQSFSGKHGQIKVLLLENEFQIPVIASIYLGDSEQEPSFLLSSAAAFDLEFAIKKSLLELSQALPAVSSSRGKKIFLQADEVQSFKDHPAFFSHPENKKYAAFLYEDSISLSLSNLTNRAWTSTYSALLEYMKSAGYDLMYKTYPTPELDQLGGIVVRALCPALIPLDYNHHLRALGGSRLRGLGHQSQTLNPYPHPLS